MTHTMTLIGMCSNLDLKQLSLEPAFLYLLTVYH